VVAVSLVDMKIRVFKIIAVNEKHFRRWGTRVPSADSL
jgi:hypothetical protein